jgi:hypothetical protein
MLGGWGVGGGALTGKPRKPTSARETSRVFRQFSEAGWRGGGLPTVQRDMCIRQGDGYDI